MVIKKNFYYIAEPEKWVISVEGEYITNSIQKKYDIPIKMITVSRRKFLRFRKNVLHFGSRNTYLPNNYNYIDKSNNIILTWYHGTDEDKEYIELMPVVSKNVDIIHTSTSITKEKLIEWGADKNKIKIIPIGIDLEMFNKFQYQSKSDIRKRLGIPRECICIGSFQKDGDGWKEGNNPKLIKGPDTLCEVLRILNEKYPVYVLLTGPARGYVKSKLTSYNIPFKHFYFKEYKKIPLFYRPLDLYLITSRAEGGPKSLLESFASDVPVVTTDMGMAHDIVVDGYNAMVSKVDDIESLVYNCRQIIEDKDLRKTLVDNSSKSVKEFSWTEVSKKYYEEIYSNYV